MDVDRGGQRAAVQSNAFLVVNSQVFPLDREVINIGRSLENHLVIDDPSVSRRHALVVAEPGKALRVLDDSSLNGVLVNGEAVEWGPLRDGDQLTIGRYSLYVLHG